ncbi:MAG TPA: MFS transporter [Stellaceae bacterium]|nr:MFS transporter [Stellaceae bacterium]
MVDPIALGTGGGRAVAESVESRASWVAAGVALAILSISFGAPLVVVVGLKPIAAALGSDRSLIALAGSLTWLGMGLGGIFAGWAADRVGVRWTVVFGAVMAACGLALSASGTVWALEIGHGLLIGLCGSGAVYPPLVVYISRWFDRRRGIAVALISSGQYVAGAVWPSAFERGIAAFGWQATMLGFAVVVLAVILPLALLLKPVPQAGEVEAGATESGRAAPISGLSAGRVQLLLCGAAFLCCVPMAMPSTHLVAFCSDLGFAPQQGALMLSVLLGCAFFSRLAWGGIADRIGGLRAVFAGSACQTLAIAAFTSTRNEAGLFAVAAAFGLGFSGIVPAYVLAIRELFPPGEASWRVPTQLFTSMSGMAFGGWFAGALYDRFGFYAPAFAAGALFNLANLAVVGFLLVRQARASSASPSPQPSPRARGEGGTRAEGAGG